MEKEKIVELLEKCKDRAYLHTHKQVLKEAFSKPKNIEFLRNELNSKRSHPVLSILQKVEFEFEKIIPSFETHKYLTQYMYTSLYWCYKKKLISPDQFGEIQEKFKIMKNHTKLFSETSHFYKTNQINYDRKLFKQIKEDSNKIKNREEEITDLIASSKPFETDELLNIKGIEPVDIFTVILNVDEIFDLSTLNFVEAEESKACIGEIKKIYSSYIGPEFFSLSKLQCIDPDSDCSVEDIPEEKELCELYTKVDKSRINFNRRQNFNLKFSNLDRMLKHKISKLHGLVNQLQKNNIEVYMVSCVSLTQLLAEITFFEFTTLELCNIFSLKLNKEKIYNKMMTMITGRTIIFGEISPLKKENVYHLDFRYLNDLVTHLEHKNRM